MARAETIRVEVGPETMKVLKAIRDALQNSNEPVLKDIVDLPDTMKRLIESEQTREYTLE